MVGPLLRQWEPASWGQPALQFGRFAELSRISEGAGLVDQSDRLVLEVTPPGSHRGQERDGTQKSSKSLCLSDSHPMGIIKRIR